MATPESRKASISPAIGMRWLKPVRLGSWTMLAMTVSGLALIPIRTTHAATVLAQVPPANAADQASHVDSIYYYLRDAQVEKESPEALLQAYMERHTARDYAGAVEMAFRLIEAVPNRPVGYYNLACSQAKLHRYERACAALELAIEHGWRNLEHTEIDPDLSPIRNRKRYTQLVAKIRRLRDNERIVVSPLRQESVADIIADLNLQVPALLERYHVPGVTLALIEDREMIWTKAFGISDTQSKEPMEIDHGFKLRAPAHLFALLAALKEETRGGYQVAGILQQGSEFDSDDPSRLMRQFNERPHAYVFGIRREGPARNSSDIRTTTYTDRIRTPTPSGWPTYQSKTTNFVLLQTAVEIASQQTFYEYCRSRLFDPLLLEKTDFLRHDENGEKQAVGHTRLGTPIETTVDRSWRTPFVLTTAPDMGRLIVALLNRDQMSEQTAVPALSLARALGPTAYRLIQHGIGVHISRMKQGPCVQLADNFGGTGCLIRWYADAGTGIVVMFNSETGPEAAMHIAHLALGGQ